MKKYFTIPEAAKIIGISRIALYKKVKSGQIKAELIGRNYILSSEDISEILGKKLTVKEKDEIDSVTKRIFNEYGKILQMLGKE